MLEQQQKMILSSYINIYNLVVPKDNLLRRISELIDFSFVYEELIHKYCLENGRNAISPIRMFKYLLLKSIYDLSDVDVVERSRYDMSFKYFLDMAPEEDVINASSLTKFRKLRLKDLNLLDMLINKTVSIALEKEIAYCKELIQIIKDVEQIAHYPKVEEKIHQLEELLQDDMEHLQSLKDEDARIGHKTADSSFFGYKTHIAMTEERIITAATITTGEKNDGKELETLYTKSKATGMEIKNIIGDAAYSEKGNIELAKTEDVNLIAKLNPSVTQGFRAKEDEFQFNKDAGMYVCKAGHMAIRKARHGKKNVSRNQADCYYFNIEKCKTCFYKTGCYKEGAKSKTYSVSIKSDIHKKQIEFQESEYFKEKAKERYKIEAKNSGHKHRHGYDVASSSGLIGMEMQGAMALFTVNLKRIIKLLDEK